MQQSDFRAAKGTDGLILAQSGFAEREEWHSKVDIVP
jgi:hypothetical protein